MDIYGTSFFFFVLNIALDHQMKALMNEKKCNHSEFKVRKDGFKKVMEDKFFFLTKSEKKKNL